MDISAQPDESRGEAEKRDEMSGILIKAREDTAIVLNFADEALD